MKKNSCKIIGTVVMLLVFVFIAATGAFGEEETFTIGLSMHFMRDDYAVNVVDSVQQVADQYNSDVIVADANADPQKQLSDIENLVIRGVDALIVVPMDETAIMAGLTRANEQNIPVIAITHIPDAEVITTVGGQGDWNNGKATAELMLEALGDKESAKILVIQIGFTLWRLEQRELAFLETMTASDIDIEFIYTSGVDQDDLQNKVQNTLLAHPDLDGVYAPFGNALVGASDAVQLANRPGVVVTGIDADLAVIERIKEGWIHGVAAQFPKQHGTLSAEAAFNFLMGESIEEEYDVPIGVVTLENADEMSNIIWGE